MKLYEVCNGFIGNSSVKVFVIADTEEKALEIARDKFLKEASEIIYGKPRYPSSYYENLTAKCLCEDVSLEWSSEVRDD